MITPVSNWQFGERIVPVGVQRENKAIEIKVPVGLPERRIYLYTELKISAAGAYKMDVVVECYREGALRGSFPATIADFTAQVVNQSVSSLFSSGGSPVGDSLSVTLAAPFTTSTKIAVIQPLRINAEIDSVQLNIRDISGAVVLGWRAYLGCLSTQY